MSLMTIPELALLFDFVLGKVNDEKLKEGERVIILESGKLRIVRDKNARK